MMQRSKSKDKTSDTDSTAEITEIHASTRAYPLWWSEMEESRVLRRRKSMGDTILERNICFIDTPGFDGSEEHADNADSVIQYIEGLLHRNASTATMSESDLLSMLSGNGGVQVDVVLYVFSHGMHISTYLTQATLTEADADTTKDLPYIRRLSSLTNVIPIISKSDLLPPTAIASLKTSILRALDSSATRPFLFGKPLETAIQSITTASDASEPAAFDPTARLTASSPDSTTQLTPLPPPYAISTLPAPDADTMDASLLMSPDYIQPLLASDLNAFVSHVLNPDTVAWLRHSAVKKFLLWRRELVERSSSPATGMSHRMPSPTGRLGLRHTQTSSATESLLRSPSPSGVLVPFARSLSPSSPSAPSSISAGATASSAHALAAHAQREERLAQVRLARWATDLRHSLANERGRFAELKREERAAWLMERVGDEVERGGLVVPLAGGAGEKGGAGGRRAEWALVRRGGGGLAVPGKARWAVGGGEADVRDPLRIAEWSERVRRGGWLAVKVVGGAGVVGAVVLAVVRVWGVELGRVVPGWEWMEGWWGE